MFYLALSLVSLITLLPLLVVLPTAPPMWDDAPDAGQGAGQNKLRRVGVAAVHIWRELWTKVWTKP